jgi:dienelactone hydrolase
MLAALVVARIGVAGQPDADALVAQLAKLDAPVLSAGDERTAAAAMLARDVRTRRDAANRRETQAWRGIATRDDWVRYRDERLRALRESLGEFPAAPADLNVRVTRTIKGTGYQIDNLVFETRPGLVATANLYLPRDAADGAGTGRMPGILICHSHHNPKTQGELQDMGITWARLGCAVLVMDALGHGERRQHPFRSADDYAGQFRVGRQDYYFRYNVGVQLHTIGDSLMGWMVWDLMRGVDLLLARPGVDRERIILLGAVAGGGDPAAVAAALDRRIAAVVPFNFGGPQPETTYPLPDAAADSFNYAGSGSWESTRNLRLSARDGFLPWVIVGSVAPRRLVYAHEFAWDREHDPVWARLQRVYALYDASDRLAAAYGHGKLSGQPPESSHCNNIGAVHRRGIYSALQKWFDMPPPEQDSADRHPAEDLRCLAPEAPDAWRGKPLHELAAEIGAVRAGAARKRLTELDSTARRKRLQRQWASLLGDVEPHGDPRASRISTDRTPQVTIDRIVLEVEPAIVVPTLVLTPPRDGDRPLPVVVGLAQHGKQAFLQHRGETIAALLHGGVAVCLPDLRGTGETRPDDSRGRSSTSTSLSSSELMLGQTLVGSRVRDLRSVLKYLRGRDDLDGSRIALWGDSFAAPNRADQRLEVPLDADPFPTLSEPIGGLAALFGALFDDSVRVVYVRGGLVSYATLLDSPFCYVPHDCVVPGSLTAGDLSDVAAALAPRPVRLESLVTGLNRLVDLARLTAISEPTLRAYRDAQATDRLQFHHTQIAQEQPAAWLLRHLASPRQDRSQ